MWFLLLQIIFLLLLAAVCGGALVWWWMRRDLEDVTETHAELLEQATRLKPLEKLDMLDRLERLDKLATREELDSASAHMVGALAGMRPPDLSPTEARLSEIEGRLKALADQQADQSGVLKPLQDIRETLALLQLTADDIKSPVEDHRHRLESLQADMASLRAAETDLGPVHSALLSLQLDLEAVKNAGQAINSVQERIKALAAQVADSEERQQSARASDIDALTSLVAEVASSISELPKTDIRALTPDLDAVKQAVAAIRIPDPDLTPVLSGLNHLQTEFDSVDRSPPDLTPVLDRIAALDSQIRTLPGDGHVLQRMDKLATEIDALRESMRTPVQPDYSPVLDAVFEIDGRDDLAAVESRITAIEYSLAALHHMLRARPDASMRAEARIRPATSTPRAAPARPVAPEQPAPEPLPDPVLAARRPNDQANLLTSALFGPADDLEQINGVGPILAALLRDVGVYYFWQVAEWTPAQADWVDSLLQHFRGRIRRDDWVGHARQLASQPGAARRPARNGRPSY